MDFFTRFGFDNDLLKVDNNQSPNSSFLCKVYLRRRKSYSCILMYTSYILRVYVYVKLLYSYYAIIIYQWHRWIFNAASKTGLPKIFINLICTCEKRHIISEETFRDITLHTYLIPGLSCLHRITDHWLSSLISRISIQYSVYCIFLNLNF